MKKIARIISSFFKNILHRHRWSMMGQEVENPNNRCFYSRFKCDCGRVSLIKTYPDGSRFITVLPKFEL